MPWLLNGNVWDQQNTACTKLIELNMNRYRMLWMDVPWRAHFHRTLSSWRQRMLGLVQITHSPSTNASNDNHIRKTASNPWMIYHSLDLPMIWYSDWFAAPMSRRCMLLWKSQMGSRQIWKLAICKVRSHIRSIPSAIRLPILHYFLSGSSLAHVEKNKYFK